MNRSTFAELRALAQLDASVRIKRRIQCDGKLAYATKGAALREMRHFRRGRPVQPYRCAHCGRWHLGSER